MIIGFVLFLILILALIIYESSQRYRYVEETRKVWAGFERDNDCPEQYQVYIKLC